MTISVPPPHRRRGRRRWLALLVMAPALVAASCRIDGVAVPAPYRSPPLPQVSAHPIRGTAGVVALSPDGTREVVADSERGVCLRAIGTPASPVPVCTDLRLVGSAPITATFSADGRWLAVGQDVDARGRGLVWLIDPRTGSARPVPSPSGRPAVGSAPPSTAGATGSDPTRPSTQGPGAASYTGMVWAAAGDLLLISNSLDADGQRTRLVDVDASSLVPRVVAEATGPYEFQSGYLATGGTAVLFTVYRGDQLLPNLVDVDLGSGARREVGPIGPAGTQLVPLAVAPDGRSAVVGLATLGHPGPPRLLDVASGRLTEIPGLTGDFGVAAFSPDGARVAVASTEANGTVSLALATPGAAPTVRARLLGAVPGPLPRQGRLSWSRFDVLSLTAPASAGATQLAGWLLTG